LTVSLGLPSRASSLPDPYKCACRTRTNAHTALERRYLVGCVAARTLSKDSPYLMSLAIIPNPAPPKNHLHHLHVVGVR
jgi:hypothetical protein